MKCLIYFSILGHWSIRFNMFVINFQSSYLLLPEYGSHSKHPFYLTHHKAFHKIFICCNTTLEFLNLKDNCYVTNVHRVVEGIIDYLQSEEFREEINEEMTKMIKEQGILICLVRTRYARMPVQ